jgi:hypothetical protein
MTRSNEVKTLCPCFPASMPQDETQIALASAAQRSSSAFSLFIRPLTVSDRFWPEIFETKYICPKKPRHRSEI